MRRPCRFSLFVPRDGVIDLVAVDDPVEGCALAADVLPAFPGLRAGCPR